MIKGLYEAHLPVADLDRAIVFYEKLGLEMALRDEETAFFWIEKRASWLGLWLSEDFETNRTPASAPANGRHIAFRVDYDDIREAVAWLAGLGIEPDSGRHPRGTEPVARPHQGNASLYFFDPDGNHLELICNLPDDAPKYPKKLVDLSEILPSTPDVR